MAQDSTHAESVALSRGELAGKGAIRSHCPGAQRPTKGAARVCGQGPISARPEPAQHSALVLVLTSHTFWCIFTAASVATLNVNKTR